MKTETRDVLIERTVNAISFDPVNAAIAGRIPISRYRLMFSITTIASSTTNPVEIASAIKDRLSTL